MKKILSAIVALMLLFNAPAHATQIYAGLVFSTVPQSPKCLTSAASNVQTAINQFDACFGSIIGGAPGAPNTSFQYNNSGNFAGGNMFQVGSNVGIGSTAPGALLDVAGLVRLQGINLNAGASLAGKVLTSDGSGNGSWQNIPSGVSGQIQYNNGGVLSGGNIYQDSNLNIGIGTTVPGSLLSIGSSAGSPTKNAININASGDITVLGGVTANINAATVDLTNGGGNIAFGNNAGNANSSVSIHTNNSTGFITLNPGSNVEGFRITAGNNVGIGSPTPRGSLDVTNSGTIFGSSFTSSAGTGSTTAQSGYTIDPTGAGGLVYLTSSRNVGIGSQYPGVLLDVASQIRSTTGNSNVPSFVAGTSNNTGLFSPTTNALSVTSNGSEMVRFINGNVGIGSIVPGAQLDVNGTARATQFVTGTGTASIQGNGNNIGINKSGAAQALDVNGTVAMLGLKMSSTPTVGYVLTASDSSGDAYWAAQTVSAIAAGGTNAVQYNGGSSTTAGNENIFSFNGNVGIGTNNGINLVDVRGNSIINALEVTQSGNVEIGTTFGNAAFSVMSGNVGIGSWNPVNLMDVKGTVTAKAFEITPAGNVGIGTQVPSQGLEVRGGLRVAGTNNLYFGDDNNTRIYPSAATVGSIDISTGSNTFRMTIGNNIGIGTISPSAALAIVTGTSNGVGIGTSGVGDFYTSTKAPAGGMMVEGNVGIGSTNPGQALDVQGTIRAISGGTCTTLYLCQGGVDAGVWQTSACTLCPASTCVAHNGCF